MSLLSMTPINYSLLHSTHALMAGSYYLLLSTLSSHTGMVISIDKSLLPSMTLLLFSISLLLVEAEPIYPRLPTLMKHLLISPIDWGLFSLLMFFCWVLIFDYSFDYIDLNKLEFIPKLAYFVLPIYSLMSWLLLALKAIGVWNINSEN
ncbi:hypothetical protein K502DRAFT_347064 [Neoconidiobolus thromboides FSU 785]|nr:hypothetical protein K502DRAFT_347064 [Neoconidiobolus thromboides FSU 785]